MRRSVVTVVAITLSAAGAMVVLWRHGSRSPHASGGADVLSDQDVREEIVALKQEVARLRARAPVSVDLGSLRAASSAPAEPSAVPERDPAAQAEEQRRRDVDVARRLGQLLSRGRADVAFADRVSRQVMDTLKGGVDGASVQATCGDSLCRLVLSHADAAAHTKLGSILAEHAPDDAEVLFQRDLEATPPTTTVYLARQGHNLRDLLADAR
jgi:hypothetical protein